VTLPPLTERTRSAHWAFEEPRYFGHRVFTELAGRESWTSMMALSIFGRRLSPELCGVLDDAVGVLTLADPRIWPLKVTRIVGTYGSMLPALCAGMLMEHEARIGPWACVGAAEALCKLHTELAGNLDPAHVCEVVAAYRKTHRFVSGFGTPFRDRDERVVAFRECLERRGRTELPYFRTLQAISIAIKDTANAQLNIGGVLAALLLDMGLAPPEIGAMVVALAQHMFFAQAIESAREPNLVLRNLPAEYVTYCGTGPRSSPRARTANGASTGMAAAVTPAG
jgi:hypothetical protein